MTVLNIIKIFLVAALAMAVSIEAGATDLKTILDNHRDALGGREAVAALKNIRAYSSVQFMDLSGQTVSIIKFPNKVYTRLDLGGMIERKGFDGLTAWTTDANGVTREDFHEEFKPMINQLYMSSYSYILKGRNPGRIVYSNDTIIGDQAYHRLKMYPKGGDSLSAFINTANGRMEYREERVAGATLITTYSDFRKIAGIEVPFSMRVETPGTPFIISATIDSIIPNTSIPDSLFTMPGLSSDDYEFPDGADSVTVKFKMQNDAIFVEVMVNGEGPFLFMLDSGASSTVLSKDLAEKLAIETSGNIPARGVGGFGNIQYGKIDSLNIGSLSWHLERITVYDFSPPVSSFLSRIDGILGYDFFVRFPMSFNFTSRRLILYGKSPAFLADYKNGIDIDIYCQVPIFEATLDGHPLRVAMDMGARIGLMIQGHSRWCREMSDLIEETTTETTIRGMGGSRTVKTTRADSLVIGEIVVEKPSVMIVGDSDAMPLPDYIEGFLGTGILKRFNIFVDYPGGKIYFENRGRNDK